MKAVMKVAAGQVALQEIEEPQPQAGQVKIAVRAAGICGTDLHIFKDEFPSVPPVVLGHELAGEVAALGEGVFGLRVGARVTTETYFSTCGKCAYCRSGHQNLCQQRRSIGSAVNGGFTNYVIVPAHNIHLLPDNVDFEGGALTEPLACVVHAVQTHNTVKAGDLAVIAGPGAIGLLTLQVVKAAGAKVVMLGTDQDAERLALAKDLGADEVVNVQDSPLLLWGADVVYECSGAGAAAQQLLQAVRRGGRYVQIGLFGKSVAWDLDQLCYKELIATGSNASIPAAWDRALQLLEKGTVQTKPLITDIFPVTEWHAAFEKFEAKKSIKTLLIPVSN